MILYILLLYTYRYYIFLCISVTDEICFSMFNKYMKTKNYIKGYMHKRYKCIKSFHLKYATTHTQVLGLNIFLRCCIFVHKNYNIYVKCQWFKRERKIKDKYLLIYNTQLYTKTIFVEY